MLFTTVCKDLVNPNEIIIFGNLEDSDWAYHDTDYIASLDTIVYNEYLDRSTLALYDSMDPVLKDIFKPCNSVLLQEPMDFGIKFLCEIGEPVTAYISKVFNTFFVVYSNIDYINLDGAKLFVQETINRFMELKAVRKETHGKSLA